MSYRIHRWSDNSLSEFESEFAELPSQLRSGPSRVGMLPPEVEREFLRLAPGGGACEFWLLESENRFVARVGISLMRSFPKTAALGFFEVDVERPDVRELSKLVLEEALEWARECGVQKVVGPLNYTTWFPYRFRTSFEDEHCFEWEPANPPLYPELWKASGFGVAEAYHTFGTEGLGRFADQMKPAYEKAIESGFSFRPMDGSAILEKEVPVLYDISLKGFSHNYLFEPITFEQFRQLYVPVAHKMDYTYSFFVNAPDGRSVGFLFSFIDKNRLVLKSSTILEEFQGQGLSKALMYCSAELASRQGVSEYVSALVKAGNRSESYSKKGTALWQHEYQLLEQSL